MRIDNDFLTLMGLVADNRDFERSIENLPPIITLDRKERIESGMKERIERNAKIDALVAKINAADDADAAIEKQTAALTEASKKTNDALAKVLKTMEAMVEAKDAAPAPNADGEGR